MSITRKFLAALGIEDDKVEAIITAHMETIQKMNDELAGAKADAEKLPGVQKELDDLKAQVAADAKDREGRKKDYDDLKEEYEQYKAEQEAKKRNAEIAAKFTELLKDMNVSEAGITKILKWRGVDGIELDETGKLVDVKDLRKSIKEDWPEYITTTETTGAQTANPPVGTAGRKTVEEIMAIPDAKERQAEIARNLDLFGQ